MDRRFESRPSIPGSTRRDACSRGQMLGGSVCLLSCVGCESIRGSTQEDSRAPGEERSPARGRETGGFQIGFNTLGGVFFSSPDAGSGAILTSGWPRASHSSSHVGGMSSDSFFPVALGWAY